MSGWSERVQLIAGREGFAYTPGRVLIKFRNSGEIGRVNAILGTEIAVPDGPDLEAAGEQGGLARTANGGWPAIDGRYTLVDFDGDVVTAVRRLTSVGIVAQPDHVFFAHAVAGNPVYGNPVYGNPVYGNPVYGNPVYGNPVYGNPVYGNPVYGNPVYGNPVYGNPVYGNPVYGNPATVGLAAPCCDPCRQGNACECVDAPPAASSVYPDPTMAGSVYSPQIARRYQATGERQTTAVPAAGPPVKRGDDPQRVAAGAALVGIPDNIRWDAQYVVRVAVLDTGWPSPGGETWSFNAHVMDGDSSDIPDADPADGRLEPVAGHGGFIAGLLSQYAPGVAVRVFKVLEAEGDGAESAIIDKIDEIMSEADRPHIVNLSFGGYVFDEALAFREALQKYPNVIFVASAGNDGVSRRQYPAAFDGVVSVAALGPAGPAPFSNWGDWVDACAPGVDLVSGFWSYDGRERANATPEPDRFDGWAQWSGTSFAAPLVAAAFARELRGRVGPTGVLDDGKVTAVMDRVIENPHLYRIPCYGTVVNPGPSTRHP